MKVLIFQLDGKIPNIALMRLSQHHRELGDDVEFRRTGQPDQMLFGGFVMPDMVYASAIFRTSIPTAERAKRAFPASSIGGTAVDPARKGEPVFLSPVISPTITNHRLGDGRLDYSIYPDFAQSIGFTQRGCRLNCEFCVVRPKEGPAHEVQDIPTLWRGGASPRELVLLDNDFFGQPNWRARIHEIREGKFKVDFNQGINARFIDDEAAEAIASVDYRHLRNGEMKVKRLFTAWDNKKDEERLFAGLNRLLKYGVKPDHIEVYMLIGFWPGETMEDCDYRRRRLREFGARPYPMPFRRTTELIGFQRFCCGAFDKDHTWKAWSAAHFRPEKLHLRQDQEPEIY